MKRKYKPQIIGLTDFAINLIVATLIGIPLIITLCFMGKKVYANYQVRQEIVRQQEEEQKRIAESVEESIRQVEQEKEERRIAQEERREQIRTELERQQVIEQMNTIKNIIAQKYPKGTCLMNLETNEMGRVIDSQEWQVITDMGWVFDFKNDSNVEMRSPKEYLKYCEKTNKKITQEELDEIAKANEKLRPAQEQMVKSLFKKNPKYCYIKTKDGEYELVKGYDGLFLVTKSGRYIYYQDAEVVHPIEWMKATGSIKNKKNGGK